MLALALTVLLETQSALLDPGLATAAQASPRPRECRAASDSSDGLWLRLRGAQAERYCDSLARGYARLEEAPAEALRAAETAEALAGAAPAVRLLRGRALLRLGEVTRAYEQFSLAESAGGQAFADPKSLHDYARAASRAHESNQAARLYRLLTSRLALLDDPRERTYCLIEAAAHVLAFVPGGADEALGYLAQARKQALGLAPWLTGLRLLALQHAGRGAPAGAPRGAPPATTFTLEPGEAGPLLAPGQLDALRALAASGAKASGAAGKGTRR